ncbi:polysaccharide biosynthesis/export family protein [Spirosoma soli]|uniref:Polysaccharide biosynthesis/export family protein n=1 Tax=Spirosoma soli TaxID=1770529 RepID=A0ABW5M9U1_9BACT
MSKLTQSKNSSRYWLKLLGFQAVVALFCSCVSTKSVTYFQGNKNIDTARYSTLKPIEPVMSTIQPGDILAIVVASTSEESNRLFNFPNTSTVNTTVFPGSTSQGQQPLGYIVDASGNVTLPIAGKIKLVGLTIKDANALVKEKLSEYVKDPGVSIRQLNHKVTVLGEVNRPGVFNLLSDQTSILELVGMAGDLTIYGRRDNVVLIRTTNNKREVVRLNFTSRDLLNSPYFFAQNNDVLYVEPRNGKLTATDRTVQLLPIFLGVTSTLLVLVNLLIR